jgi:hypothetical protein
LVLGLKRVLLVSSFFVYFFPDSLETTKMTSAIITITSNTPDQTPALNIPAMAWQLPKLRHNSINITCLKKV